MSDKMPDWISDRILEYMSGKISERMPNKISNGIPDKCQIESYNISCPKECQRECQIECQIGCIGFAFCALEAFAKSTLYYEIPDIYIYINQPYICDTLWNPKWNEIWN